MFKKKKKSVLIKEEIPSIEEVNKLVKYRKDLDVLHEKVLIEKVEELVGILQKRYEPYLEALDMSSHSLYADISKDKYYKINKNSVSTKHHDIRVGNDYERIEFLKDFNAIIEAADNQIIKAFKSREASNTEIMKEINFILSINKEEDK